MIWERPWACRLSEIHIESHQFIGWWHGCHHWHPLVISLWWRNAPSAPQISLPSRSGHISPSVAIFLARFWLFYSGFFFVALRRLQQWNPFSLRWSAMEYHRCQPPCSRFIASDDPHSKCVKCMDFSHAHEAVALGLWFLKGNHSFFPTVLRKASAALRESASRGLGCRAGGNGERAERPRPFSPSLTWACACKFSGWIRALIFIS